MKKLLFILMAITLAAGNVYSQAKRTPAKRTNAGTAVKQKAITGSIADEWFKGKNSVTFYGKEVGSPTTESVGGFKQLGLVEGDIIYECTLVLRKDGSGTVTYKLFPSESSFNNQRIHYRKDGVKIRHGEFVTDFCNAINNDAKPENGKWSIDGLKLTFDDRNFEISEDHKKLVWEFLEYCNLYLK